MADANKRFRFSLFEAKEKTIEVPPKEEKKSLEINVQDYLEQSEQQEISAGDAVLKDWKIVTSAGNVFNLTPEQVKALAAYEYSGEAKRNSNRERLQRLIEEQSEQTR